MNPTARGMVMVAVTSGALIVVAVLLWVSELIGLPVFLGAIVLISVAQMGVTMRILGRQRRGGPAGPPAPGGRATGEGFDPMGKHR